MLSQKKIIDKDTKKEKMAFRIMKDIPLRNDDIYITANSAIPLNKLSIQFYGEAKYWRLIASVNGLTSIFPPSGITLRIPITPEVFFHEE